MPDENDTLDAADAAAQQLLAVLPLLTRIVATEVRREAGDETTMPQFRVLAHLAEEPQTVSALARRRHVTLQSMGELVQSLVERGWISRTPDPADRRQHLLALTDQGRRHYEGAHASVLAQLVPRLANLSPHEMAAVQVALPALSRMLTGEPAASDISPRGVPGESIRDRRT